MRGNRLSAGVVFAGRGSIPAYAGEPTGVVDIATIGAVYPRVCGGTLYCYATGTSIEGLSPRMRGNQFGQSRAI